MMMKEFNVFTSEGEIVTWAATPEEAAVLVEEELDVVVEEVLATGEEIETAEELGAGVPSAWNGPEASEVWAQFNGLVQPHP